MFQSSSSRAVGVGISVGAAIIFGLYPPAAKATYAAGANAPLVVMVTTFLRAAALILFCLVTRKKIVPDDPCLRIEQGKAALAGGVCQALSVFGIIASLSYLPAAVTIILVFMHTVMLLGWLLYKRELAPSPVVVITTALALLGVSFVIDLWSQTTELNVWGITLALIAAIATATRLYVVGKQVIKSNPAVVGAQVFTVAALCTTLLFLYEQPTLPTKAIGYTWLTLSCASLVLGTFGMLYGIAQLGSFQWSLMAKLEPVFTALFAYLVLSETLQVSQYMGMVLVLGSLIAYQLLAPRAVL